jgi:hypothetical protein
MSTHCFLAAAPSDVDQNYSGPPPSLTPGDHWMLCTIPAEWLPNSLVKLGLQIIHWC